MQIDRREFVTSAGVLVASMTCMFEEAPHMPGFITIVPDAGGQDVAFVWLPASQWTPPQTADSYVLRVGTSTGNYNKFDQDVGNVQGCIVNLTPGNYWACVVPYNGGVAGTPSAEQTVSVPA